MSEPPRFLEAFPKKHLLRQPHADLPKSVWTYYTCCWRRTPCLSCMIFTVRIAVAHSRSLQTEKPLRPVRIAAVRRCSGCLQRLISRPGLRRSRSALFFPGLPRLRQCAGVPAIAPDAGALRKTDASEPSPLNRNSPPETRSCSRNRQPRTNDFLQNGRAGIPSVRCFSGF